MRWYTHVNISLRKFPDVKAREKYLVKISLFWTFFPYLLYIASAGVVGFSHARTFEGKSISFNFPSWRQKVATWVLIHHTFVRGRREGNISKDKGRNSIADGIFSGGLFLHRKFNVGHLPPNLSLFDEETAVVRKSNRFKRLEKASWTWLSSVLHTRVYIR